MPQVNVEHKIHQNTIQGEVKILKEIIECNWEVIDESRTLNSPSLFSKARLSDW
jgi:hypothetical protein